MKKRHHIAGILFLLIGAMIGSCTHDDESQGQSSYVNPDHITLNITRGLSATDIGTGAIAEEMIYNWTIVIVNAANQVEATLTRGNFSGMSSTPVEAEEVRLSNYSSPVKLTNGAKKIYTFVNMAVPTAFTQSTITEAAANALTTTVGGNGFVVSASNPIPMTSIVTATLDDRQIQKIEIPVKRLMAKVRFDFSNLTTSAITVTGIKMKYITQNAANNVYLFQQLSGTLPVLPSAATQADYTAYSGSLSVAANNAATVSQRFYLNESPKPTNVEYIGFTLTTQKAGSATTETRYALTDVNALKRNDYLIIPIGFTSYVFQPRIDFYPPIGGYAQADITSDASEVFYCTFKSAGQFVLRPQLYNSATMAQVASSAVSVTVTPVEGSNLLNGTVSLSPTDGWWTGMLTGNEGRLLLTLTYQVTESGVTFTLERKIYLIVKH